MLCCTRESRLTGGGTTTCCGPSCSRPWPARHKGMHEPVCVRARRCCMWSQAAASRQVAAVASQKQPPNTQAARAHVRTHTHTHDANAHPHAHAQAHAHAHDVHRANDAHRAPDVPRDLHSLRGDAIGLKVAVVPGTGGGWARGGPGHGGGRWGSGMGGDKAGFAQANACARRLMRWLQRRRGIGEAARRPH